MNLPGRFLKSGSSSESDFLPNLSSDKNNHLFQLLLRLRMFISSYEKQCSVYYVAFFQYKTEISGSLLT